MKKKVAILMASVMLLCQSGFRVVYGADEPITITRLTFDGTSITQSKNFIVGDPITFPLDIAYQVHQELNEISFVFEVIKDGVPLSGVSIENANSADKIISYIRWPNVAVKKESGTIGVGSYSHKLTLKMPTVTSTSTYEVRLKEVRYETAEIAGQTYDGVWRKFTPTSSAGDTVRLQFGQTAGSSTPNGHPNPYTFGQQLSFRYYIYLDITKYGGSIDAAVKAFNDMGTSAYSFITSDQGWMEQIKITAVKIEPPIVFDNETECNAYLNFIFSTNPGGNHDLIKKNYDLTVKFNFPNMTPRLQEASALYYKINGKDVLISGSDPVNTPPLPGGYDPNLYITARATFNTGLILGDPPANGNVLPNGSIRNDIVFEIASRHCKEIKLVLRRENLPTTDFKVLGVYSSAAGNVKMPDIMVGAPVKSAGAHIITITPTGEEIPPGTYCVRLLTNVGKNFSTGTVNVAITISGLVPGDPDDPDDEGSYYELNDEQAFTLTKEDLKDVIYTDAHNFYRPICDGWVG